MNLFIALARNLRARGHRITFFGLSDNESKVREAGLDFEVLEPDAMPLGTLGAMMRQMSSLENLSALRLQAVADANPRYAQAICNRTATCFGLIYN